MRSWLLVLIVATLWIDDAFAQSPIRITGAITFEHEADRGMANTNPGAGKLAFPPNTTIVLEKWDGRAYALDTRSQTTGDNGSFAIDTTATPTDVFRIRVFTETFTDLAASALRVDVDGFVLMRDTMVSVPCNWSFWTTDFTTATAAPGSPPILTVNIHVGNPIDADSSIANGFNKNELTVGPRTVAVGRKATRLYPLWMQLLPGQGDFSSLLRPLFHDFRGSPQLDRRIAKIRAAWDRNRRERAPPSQSRNGSAGADPFDLAALGNRALEPVDSEGRLLFHGGHYVDGPYRVTRKANAIYVNDLVLNRRDWPGKYYVANDPALPTGLTRNSTFEDLAKGYAQGRSWATEKAGWLHSHFKPDEALRRHVDAYRSLPFVERVALLPTDDAPRTMEIVTFAGEKRTLGIDNADLRPRSKQSLLKLLDAEMDDWRKTLAGDGFAFHVSYGGLFFGRGAEMWEALPEVMDVLKSSASPEAKGTRVYALWKHAFPSQKDLNAYLRPLLQDFRGSAQLDRRMAKIREARARRDM